jgi:hypothetical protein
MELHPVKPNEDEVMKPLCVVRNPLTEDDHELMKGFNVLTPEQIKTFSDTGCLVIPAAEL